MVSSTLLFASDTSSGQGNTLLYLLLLLLLLLFVFFFFAKRMQSERAKAKKEAKTSGERGTNPEVLEAYRIESKKIKIENQPFRLSGLLHILTNKIGKALKAHNHHLHYDVDSEVGRYIVGDNDYIEQILEALLKNTIVLGTDSEIVLSIFRSRQNFLVFDVSNEKGVISKVDCREYLTTESISTEKSEELNSFVKAKKIAEAMGGSLTLSSNKRSGTHYTLKIPYIPDKDNRSHQQQLKKFLEGKRALFIGKTKYETKRVQYIFETYGIKISDMKLEDFEKKKPDLSRYDMVIIRSSDLTAKHIAFFKRIYENPKSEFKIIISHELFEPENKIALGKSIAHAELFNPAIIGDVEEILYQMFILKSKAVKGISNMEVFDPETFVLKGSRSVREGDLKKFSGAHIAVAEDSKVDQRVIRNILNKAEGASLFFVENGLDMIKLLEEKEIDIIFTDINMPLLDGLTMTKRIRSNPKWENIPIISISSMAFKHEIRSMVLAGMNATISKPITAQEVYRALERFLKVTPAMQARSLKKEQKRNVYTDYDRNILDVQKGLDEVGEELQYMEILLETRETLKGSAKQVSKLIYDDEYLAMKAYARSLRDLYKNIHANEMVKILDELTHYVYINKKVYLMEYTALYQKNWMDLQKEIDRFVAFVIDEES
ncbi:hypothetical protein YH65_04285 [Sulfurovum lithotrophicum]|uniref:Response regulatory domain-containing protein n=2 Tax=Sulfurovum lithotrophicum TaxID=206403 RepID=A0A7U4M0Q1_9BACT|nr:hypothetical protein YH65_04285 [Sulfurovum lithotrophicum]